MAIRRTTQGGFNSCSVRKCAQAMHNQTRTGYASRVAFRFVIFVNVLSVSRNQEMNGISSWSSAKFRVQQAQELVRQTYETRVCVQVRRAFSGTRVIFRCLYQVENGTRPWTLISVHTRKERVKKRGRISWSVKLDKSCKRSRSCLQRFLEVPAATPSTEVEWAHKCSRVLTTAHIGQTLAQAF